MKTKLVKLDPIKPNQQLLLEAGEIIKNGGLVAFPTETVYGLGANALEEEAAKKTYCAKGRPLDNPLIIHIATWQALAKITKNLPKEAKELADHFWPGPLTMIFEKSEWVPYSTTGGLETVAVRIPENEIARKLILAAGGYVSAPSANISGKPSPTSAAHVVEDLAGKIEMVLDGGQVHIGIESTILDMTVTPPAILRPGRITKEMIAGVIGEVETAEPMSGEDDEAAPKAPGMKYRHYAPEGVLQIVKGEPLQEVEAIKHLVDEKIAAGYEVGVIASDETYSLYSQGIIKNLGSRKDEEAIARNLYRILREFNEEKVAYIYSESFPGQGFWAAVRNRLDKAAGQAYLSAGEIMTDR